MLARSKRVNAVVEALALLVHEVLVTKAIGKQRTRGGRAGVLSILFLVAATAARYDRSLGDFRDRLLKAGKEKMVVRIALARKLSASTQKPVKRVPNTPMQLGQTR